MRRRLRRAGSPSTTRTTHPKAGHGDRVQEASKQLKKDMLPGIRKSRLMQRLRPELFKERDGIIYKHIKEQCFPAGCSALMRLSGRYTETQ